jgi:alpha-glucosidase
VSTICRITSAAWSVSASIARSFPRWFDPPCRSRRSLTSVAVAWWHDAVLYQIYPRSFRDSNGDGIGDLPGVISKLDYLADLGVGGIWLNPITPSPNVDWGYDVADYTAVAPEYGTVDDLDALVADAAERGILVLVDLVPNHTSIRHRWFREHPEYYVWCDRIPNNWLASFGGGPAWTWDEQQGAYYLHNFAKEQPDLDWWSEDVRAEFERILRFWLDRGVAGFRIDVAHALIHDRELRDDPLPDETDPPHTRRLGRRHVYSMNRPETHEILRRWRVLADGYDPRRVLLGEAYVLDPEKLAAFYGDGGNELDLAFAFALLHAELAAAPMRIVVEQVERAFPPEALPAWTGSNHDSGRLATRWAGGDERRAQVALTMLLTLRGVPVLYMGDELALEDGEVSPDRVLDVQEPPRDPCRTPFPWTREGREWRNPWLPFTPTDRNAAESRTLPVAKELIRLRREISGPYEPLDSPPGTWSYRRGSGHTIVLAFDAGAEWEGKPAFAVGASGEPWSAAVFAPR